MSGRQIRIFLADGTPGGLTTAEIVNWTGHVVVASRSDLSALLKREELTRTGVYILLGIDPESGVDMAYIGEGDSVGKRLVFHAKDPKKEFWDRVVVLTSKDLNLTKAHGRYLESRFLAIAADAVRVTLANGTAPPPIGLPEADESDMEYFIAQAQILLPVLGVNLLRPTRALVGDSEELAAMPTGTSPTFVIRDSQGADATAHEIDGEFIVSKGSIAREWSGVEQSKRKLRQELEDQGVLELLPHKPVYQFTQDYVFKSPSAAAVVVLGRTANGRSEWKLQNGKTYGDWQDSSIEESAHQLTLEED